MPVPRAVMMERHSSFSSTCSMRLFSTFNGLPRSGSIAWNRLSRPCFALPPAESPSTMKSSFCSGVLPVQLESLPTRGAFSSLDFSRAMVFAFLAASRAFAALTALSAIAAARSEFLRFSSIGVSSSITTASTAVRASVLPSFVFVCPSN